MPKYNVTIYRQIVFSKTVEVEADDEDEAIDEAEETIEDDDVGSDEDGWEWGVTENYGSPEVEEIEEDEDA